MASRARPAPPPQRLILDAGAVIALSRRDQRAQALLSAAVEAGADVSIPASVVAETVRGTARDAPVHRVLKAVGSVDVLDEPIARNAGRLLGASRSDATLDALVVATAQATGSAVVLTGDPRDLTPLAAELPHVRIQAL